MVYASTLSRLIGPKNRSVFALTSSTNALSLSVSAVGVVVGGYGSRVGNVVGIGAFGIETVVDGNRDGGEDEEEDEAAAVLAATRQYGQDGSNRPLAKCLLQCFMFIDL